jgi:dTDP-4-dehydrorhamnose reductase
MRIVITGAAGMLGTDLIKVLDNEEYELHGIDIKEPSYNLQLKTYNLLDITDAQETYRIITKINPDLVIHTAAYTKVDDCEKNSELAYRVNSLGTRNLALACQRFDTALMYISTDYVFDGEKGVPYVEYDQPNPASVYGESKYWGERFVQSLLTKFYIVRTSGLYGMNGDHFVKSIRNLALEKKELKVVKDQVSSTTYSKDLAQAIAKLISPPASRNQAAVSHLYGIWHITNSESCSWYEFAREIISLSRYKVKLTAITARELKRPAKRPQYSVLANHSWQLEGWKPLRNWKEALKDYLREEKAKNRVQGPVNS